MTRGELRELLATHPTVPFLAALEAIGVSETAGRKAHSRGELPFRVLTVGRWKVPSVDLEALLEHVPDMDAATPARAADATTTAESVKGTRDASERPTLRAVQH